MKPRQAEGFYYELGTLLSTGFPLLQALALLEKPHREDARALERRLGEGIALWEAMRELPGIPLQDAEILRLAEETGHLAEAYLELHGLHRDNRELKSKLISFAIYPILMLILVVVYLIFALFFMVPMMADLIRSLEVRDGFLFRLDGFRLTLLRHGPVVLIGSLLGLVAAAWLFQRCHGALRLVLGKRFRLYLEVAAVERLTKLLKGGRSILDVLDLAGDMSGIDGESIREALLAGEALSTSFERGGFSRELTTLIRIHEEGGNLTGGFELYLKNARRTIHSTMEARIKLLEPLSMVFIGAVVGLTVVSIMGPLMDAFGRIQ